MDVQVLYYDLAAAVAECPGQEFSKAAGTVPTSRSLAYCELLLSM
ncbi:hypothetical protein AB4Z54_11985 [Streptomyces sp. MCAF7]